MLPHFLFVLTLIIYPSGALSISSGEVLPSVQASQPVNEGSDSDDPSSDPSISSDEILPSVKVSQPANEESDSDGSEYDASDHVKCGPNDTNLEYAEKLMDYCHKREYMHALKKFIKKNNLKQEVGETEEAFFRRAAILQEESDDPAASE